MAATRHKSEARHTNGTDILKPNVKNILADLGASTQELKELVLYSPQHIARLEKADKFPKRVQLGPNRVGWVEREVLDWLEERLRQRS